MALRASEYQDHASLIYGSTETVCQEIDGVESGKPFTIKIGVGPRLAVLRGTGPALVKMGKNEITLPDEGRANAIAKFAKTCKLE